MPKAAAGKKSASKTRGKSAKTAEPIPSILKKEMTRPKLSDLYFWCDFIELKCLVDTDRRYGRGRLHELLDDTAQLYGEQTDADDDGLGIDFDEDGEGEQDGGAEPNIEDLEEGLISAPSGNDIPPSLANESRVAGYFKNLAYRAELFGDAYPFALSSDHQEILVRPIDTAARKLYVQLLLSSSLRLVPDTRWAELTETFEIVSEQIFAKLMPSGWQVHRFGAKGATRYKGLLFDKLTKLATDLRSELRLQAHDFKPNNRGDGGLDLVAWHPMGDSRDSIPIALAQCGCTADEWSKKSLEAAPAKLWPHIPTLHPWATYYFMPHDLVSFVGTKQDWQRRAEVTSCIVVDRLRLLKLAAEYDVLEACAVAHKPVEEAQALQY